MLYMAHQPGTVELVCKETPPNYNSTIAIHLIQKAQQLNSTILRVLGLGLNNFRVKKISI